MVNVFMGFTNCQNEAQAFYPVLSLVWITLTVWFYKLLNKAIAQLVTCDFAWRSCFSAWIIFETGNGPKQLLLLLVDFTYSLYNRQYEEKQLKGQQAREEKKLEFANLQQRLQNQLEFEKQKNPASVFVYRGVCMWV